MTSLWIFFALAAYLLGSVPFGKLIASGVARVDIRQRGSGNIGATNVARELGVKWGLFTLSLDMLKGFLPVAIFARTASDMGGNDIGLFAVGLLALVGHQFSVFLKFRGGKGVATAVGVYLVISLPACLAGVLVFVLTVYKWHFISLGSILSAAAMPGLLALFGGSQVTVIGSAIVAALICLKHAGNIERLLKGKERKWRSRRNQASKSRSLSSSSSE
jgi:glycerol-3-phosphate acyltransferase PlsY